MSQELWSDVDRYIVDRLLPPDAALEAALADSERAGLPPIAVAPNQGKMLMLLARLSGARTILEVGTLGGYSTIWLASALPAGGRLVTLEVEPKHADVAQKNIARAGFSDVVELRLGSALDSLEALSDEPGREPFDFTFIDADKQGNADYFRWALRLSRVGSVIVVDNVVRRGEVARADSDDPRVVGSRRLYDAIAAEPRVTATAVQTVGSKGHDGFVLSYVVA